MRLALSACEGRHPRKFTPRSNTIHSGSKCDLVTCASCISLQRDRKMAQTLVLLLACLIVGPCLAFLSQEKVGITAGKFALALLVEAMSK